MSLFVIRTAQGGTSSLEAMLTENGVAKFNYDLIVAVVMKLYSIDLSTFETKFKKPGAAYGLAFDKTSHVQTALGLFTGMVTSMSGIFATAMILYKKNPKLLATMLGTNLLLNIMTKVVVHTQDLTVQAVSQGAIQADVQSQFAAIESEKYFTMSRCFCQEEENVKRIRTAFDSGTSQCSCTQLGSCEREDTAGIWFIIIARVSALMNLGPPPSSRWSSDIDTSNDFFFFF